MQNIGELKDIVEFIKRVHEGNAMTAARLFGLQVVVESLTVHALKSLALHQDPRRVLAAVTADVEQAFAEVTPTGDATFDEKWSGSGRAQAHEMLERTAKALNVGPNPLTHDS